MNLKEAVEKFGTQELTTILKRLFHYDKETGKVLLITSSLDKHWSKYVTDMARAVDVGTEDQKAAAREIFNEFTSNPEMRRSKIEEFQEMFPTRTKDTTYMVQGKYPTVAASGFVIPVNHLVWFFETGTVPHRLKPLDKNLSNTRFSNLIEASAMISKGSELKPYQAIVVINNRQHHLGRFSTREEVKAAREAFREKVRAASGNLEKAAPVTPVVPELPDWMR